MKVGKNKRKQKNGQQTLSKESKTTLDSTQRSIGKYPANAQTVARQIKKALNSRSEAEKTAFAKATDRVFKKHRNLLKELADTPVTKEEREDLESEYWCNPGHIEGLE